MQINIGNYRIRRYDKLNLCVEVRKEKQKAKNPYGRYGKKSSATIIQNNSSNKVEYIYHLIGYYSTLDQCLEKLTEDCLTNSEEINTINELKQQISELHEKINKISAENNREIEQNISSNKDEDEEYASEIADELAKECLE